MSEAKAKICLLRLVRSVEQQAVQVQEMAPRAWWAQCGLCRAHGGGTSKRGAARKLAHAPGCSLVIAAKAKTELSHAAA